MEVEQRSRASMAAAGTRYSVGIGMTSACNMSCSFCYSKGRRASCDSLELGAWLGFFRRNRADIEAVNFGTGENTLHDAWYSLIDYLRSGEIRQALTTNGTLARVIECDGDKRTTVCACIDEVDVSIDYCDARTHNRIRGHHDAFDMALETLQFCAESSIRPTIVMLGNESTMRQDNLEGLLHLADRYDALLRVNLYRPVAPGTVHLAPSFEAIVAMFDWMSSNHQICSISDPLFGSILGQRHVDGDPSGISSFRILPDGGVYPSTYLIQDQYCIGSILGGPALSEARCSEVVQRLVDTVPADCQDCELCLSCRGGAVDRRVLWYGTTHERDPYCPNRHGLPVKLRDYAVEAGSVESVHDGYLPTLFFKKGPGQ